MLNSFFTLLIVFAFCVQSTAQTCNLNISGRLTDETTSKPIVYGNVFIKELKLGSVSDTAGNFKIQGVCPGNYHLVISHIGCETIEYFLNLRNDTVMGISLDHNHHHLHEVSITAKLKERSIQESQTIGKQDLEENGDKNLSTLLDQMSGVSSIKNGSGIAKPVVHGLYGNRLAIMNNGVAQSGQQWGVDHSPEIDPLSANEITVIKGVGAVEYQGNSLGSVILVEPSRIKREPHLHGSGNYFFESNGLGNVLHFSLQQYKNVGLEIGWKVDATVKKSGDNRSPNYYLRNTGNEEANVALQFEKAIRKNWIMDAYLSSFNAKPGVLRGAHIGNLTDLDEAFNRSEPFFTQDKFSYEIEAPRQQVNHHLMKLHSMYFITPNQKLEFTYAVQLNQRKEFDVRRGGRSDIPTLSLDQVSNFGEVKYLSDFGENWEFKTGVQVNHTDNTNVPETNILPLIPNYVAIEYGAFGILAKAWDKTTFEIGGRYDLENRNVATISNSVPRSIVKYSNSYSNFSAMSGVSQQLIKNWKLLGNIGFANRNPEVNELYSNGLHQGVSGIELGEVTLRPEQSLKGTLSLKGKVKNKLFFEALGYYQVIEDYIFLNPSNEVRLTIRGAFPVFKYEQTNASIYGLDFSTVYQITSHLETKIQYSYLKGDDNSQGIPLIFMPANNLYGALTYDVKNWNLGRGKWENIELQVNNRFVFEQMHILPSQDFIQTPKAYNLIGAKVSAERQVGKFRFNFYLRAENILNTVYRDYLNRQRYFADDLGVNIIAGINAKF
tara:strand:- start:78639 stop:80969 length:2331 start_codon:yes stop_codon:yes gene_type:complete